MSTSAPPLRCARLATGRPFVSGPPSGPRGGGDGGGGLAGRQRVGMTAGRGQGTSSRRGRRSPPLCRHLASSPYGWRPWPETAKEVGLPPLPTPLGQPFLWPASSRKRDPVVHSGLLVAGPTGCIRGSPLLPTPLQEWGSGCALPRQPRPDTATRGYRLLPGTSRVSRRGGRRVSGPEKRTPARAPAGASDTATACSPPGLCRSWAQRPLLGCPRCARVSAVHTVGLRALPASSHPLRGREAPDQRTRVGDKRPYQREGTGCHHDHQRNPLHTHRRDVRCQTGCAPDGRADIALQERSLGLPVCRG